MQHQPPVIHACTLSRFKTHPVTRFTTHIPAAFSSLSSCWPPPAENNPIEPLENQIFLEEAAWSWAYRREGRGRKGPGCQLRLFVAEVRGSSGQHKVPEFRENWNGKHGLTGGGGGGGGEWRRVAAVRRVESRISLVKANYFLTLVTVFPSAPSTTTTTTTTVTTTTTTTGTSRPAPVS
ncbi:hypothetical protein E2C01_081103 [Portunus trituberculatus]|uniref:Uncharacterized protein n=1 Tax=Portunus trituberculatus TaxID=210409 RepID=A0A5B7INY3_PORTR|nr:hypothetical protein [Portunus trituberculatus]